MGRVWAALLTRSQETCPVKRLTFLRVKRGEPQDETRDTTASAAGQRKKAFFSRCCCAAGPGNFIATHYSYSRELWIGLYSYYHHCATSVKWHWHLSF